MQQAETKGDVGAMQTLAAREQASIDRVYTSLPEIVFASGKPERLQKALARMMATTRNATTALSAFASQ